MVMEAKDLKPGMRLMAKMQGLNISPHSVEVEVVWIDDGNVHYRMSKPPGVRVYQTPLAHFLEIVE